MHRVPTFRLSDSMILPETGFGPPDQCGDDLNVDKVGVILIREVSADFWIEIEEELLLLRPSRDIRHSLDPYLDFLSAHETDLNPVVLHELFDLPAPAVSGAPEAEVVHHHKSHGPDPGLAVNTGGQIPISSFADDFPHFIYGH